MVEQNSICSNYITCWLKPHMCIKQTACYSNHTITMCPSHHHLDCINACHMHSHAPYHTTESNNGGNGSNTGPNNETIIWAPGKFFLMFSFLFLSTNVLFCYFLGSSCITTRLQHYGTPTPLLQPSAGWIMDQDDDDRMTHHPHPAS